ncbi:MAG: hypothetical protein Q7S27_03515 [Nanoarchaeota archaeon]|nr:hypothetical protein [Nanoarchaeota archaeon]
MKIEANNPKAVSSISRILKQVELTTLIAIKVNIRKLIKLPNHSKRSQFILI